ncbi:hypothetical protein K440DRAFT_628542 [Wilcoxina mikolae CBS 423.85]|nr:hypothetical protein K440DRAFT_628542 [Wilcoxina mikolae CBS 423.85]
MVLLDKLECTINTADGVLEEFPVPPEDDKDSDAPYPLKTVYIKAGEGKEFYIKFKAHYYAPKNEPEYDTLGLLVVLDGRGDHYNRLHLTERLWWSKNTRSTFPNSSVNRTIKGRTNGNMLRKFRFSKINLTEELGGNYHIPDERLDLLGDIKVIVIRYKSDITRGNSHHLQ